MLMKTGILYFTTCFHGFGILRHVDPFVRMLHILEMQKTYFHNTFAMYKHDMKKTWAVISETLNKKKE